MELVGQPGNESGLSDSEVFQAAVTGLQRWEAAAPGTLRFDYWQGSDPDLFLPRGDLNGQSSLYFASRSADVLDPEVLGLTQVWYEADTGRIFETDIVLNDLQYRLTARPQDTGGADIFIENVLTHELGHAFGLSHSGVMQATMLHTEGPEQAHLGCDDQLGIREVYRVDRGTGGIRATIEDPAGRPLLGAQVVAISRENGTVMRASLADREGRAHLSLLKPGTYDLILEPYAAGAAPLPSYYAALEHRICPGGTLFRRQFVRGPFEVRQGKTTSIGRLAASCQSGFESHAEDAQTLLAAGEDSGAAAGQLADPAAWLRLEHSGGDLAVRLLSFTLFSPAQARGILRRDRNGRPGSSVPFTERVPMEVGESGFTNFDSELRAQSLNAGVYWLEVRSAAIPATYFPGGLLLRDPEPFFVALAQRGELPATDPRCRQDERFGAYASPPGDPPRRSVEEFGRPAHTASTPGCGGGQGAAQVLLWLFVVRCLGALPRVRLKNEAAFSRHSGRHGFFGRILFERGPRRHRAPARLSG